MTDNTTTKAKDTLALPASSAASSAEPGSFLEKGPIEAERGSESNEAPPAEEQGYRQQFSKISWVLMCANLFTSSFLYGLDNTIVADIQGHIIEDFGDIEKLGWFVLPSLIWKVASTNLAFCRLGIGFPLGSVATILSIGRAYGLFDNKWVYIVSLIMFEAGSALCGGAPNMDAMIIGRVWAGVGGAGIYLG
jgi:hypothetical protein